MDNEVFYELELQGLKQAIAIATIYTEALARNNYIDSEPVVQDILREIIESSKDDGGLLLRLRYLLKSLVIMIDCAHSGMDLDTLEEKLGAIQKFAIVCGRRCRYG
jgi:hypothetical protein